MKSGHGELTNRLGDVAPRFADRGTGRSFKCRHLYRQRPPLADPQVTVPMRQHREIALPACFPPHFPKLQNYTGV